MESQQLPEFGRPPLNELVLGIQFATPQFYSPALVTEVWSLYRHRFSRSEVQGPIGPRFETFGGLPPQNAPSLQFLGAPPPPRFWFVTPDGNEIVQFQPDKLLHNWRQVDGARPVAYPRFHNVVKDFAAEINALSDYFRAHSEALAINQAEVSYVNRIYAEDGELPDPSDWLTVVAYDGAEAVSGVIQQVITDDVTEQPVGRLYIEFSSAFDNLMRPFLNLTLTLRGAPSSTDADAAIAFLSQGHEIIVNVFTEITTNKAHSAWHRQR